MSRWSIYRNAGGAPTMVAVCDSLEYHDEWMGDCYVSVTVKSDHAIDFQLSDYIYYRGEFFFIGNDPNVVKKAKTSIENGERKGKYGEGFVYENIKLYSEGSRLAAIGFKDYVLNWNSASNQNVYSSLGTFSFFAGSIDDLADRLQANLDRVDNGQWKVFTPDYIRTNQRISDMSDFYSYYNGYESYGENDINIDVDKQSCRDILKYSYEKFGLSYYIKGKNIIIGGMDISVSHIFRYGKNNGLYEIERSCDEAQELVTKVYAYGSDTNMPPNYYANIGKRIKFTIAHKTEREIIMNNPMLLMWVRTPFIPASQLYRAFSPTFSCTITCGGTSITAHVSGDTFTYADEKEDPTFDHDTKYMFFWLQSNDVGARAFYDSVQAGSSVYVTGVNINKIPDTFIELPQNNNYPALLAINRLMLPGFPYTSLHDYVAGNEDLSVLLSKYVFSKDPQDPWIMSKNYLEAGVLEGTVVYDGQQQKEIYPSIENTNFNFVAEGSHVEDNGYVNDGGTFTIKLGVYQNAGMNWKKAFDERLSGDTMVISMNTGWCVGRDFEVTKVEENATYILNGNTYLAYELTLQRVEDEEGRWLPHNQCQIQTGDKYVVSGIQMPAEYIEAAARKMLIAACGWLDRRDHMRYTYLPKIDEIYMARQHDQAEEGKSYHDILRAGMRLQIEDTDLGIERYNGNGNTAPFIDILTIKENGNNGIPTYDVVLRDEKEKGALEKLAESIEDLKKDTESMMERQKHPTRDRTYEEWDPNGLYYYQTLNPEPDPVTGIVYIETSYVWHNGKLWMCLRTLTTEEPKFGCHDWKCMMVGGIDEYEMRFLDANEVPYSDIIQTKPGYVNLFISPIVLWGNEDITEMADSWQWHKYYVDEDADPSEMNSSGMVEDIGWGMEHTEREIMLTDEDMPTAWGRLNPVIFECVATFEDVEIEIARKVGFA